MNWFSTLIYCDVNTRDVNREECNKTSINSVGREPGNLYWCQYVNHSEGVETYVME